MIQPFLRDAGRAFDNCMDMDAASVTPLNGVPGLESGPLLVESNPKPPPLFLSHIGIDTSTFSEHEMVARAILHAPQKKNILGAR